MRSLIILSLVLAVHLTAVAEEVNVKTIRAVKIQPDEVPVIDGRLDDECWKKASSVSDFIQF